MESVENLKISVIMLTYNREDFIERAIESILGQTLKDFEFIIVDNGSTDRSGVIADEYARKTKAIRVIHRERGNIGSGRNTGLDAAQGEYIAFIDDDDYAEQDFLEFLYNLAAKNNADIAICGDADKIFDEKLVMTPEEALIELMWRKRYNMAFPTKMFKRELVEHLRFPEEGRYDDISVMYKLLASANCVAYHGLPKYTFTRHTNNNSAWTTNHNLLTRETLDEYLCAYRERTEWLIKLFPQNEEAWQYFEWSFKLSMIEKITRYALRECFAMRDELIRAIRSQADKFLGSDYILEFEKRWVKEYALKDFLPLRKFTLIVITRCNLRCKLCCEYVPQNKAFPDMTVFECKEILECLFDTVDYINTLHLSGGGEPFLHPHLSDLVEASMEYANRFDRLMMFTNCTLMPSQALMDTMKKYGDKIVLQVSRYGIKPEHEKEVLSRLQSIGIPLKIEKYYGENQPFGGWINFGEWKPRERTEDELKHIFKKCAVTRDMQGNWRTRDGKVHWCSRSQRGMELGLIPASPQDYVDLLDDTTTREEQREKFRRIGIAQHLNACDYCSGDQGTQDSRKRYPAAEQL